MNSFPNSIAIIDDHPLITNGLNKVFVDANWPTKIHLFNDKNLLCDFIEKHTIDIFLIDIQLKDEDGRELIKYLKIRSPKSKFIALSSFDEPHIIRSTFAQGADNYIIKSIAPKDLLVSISSLWNGKIIHQQLVTDAIQYKIAQSSKTNKYSVPHLTPREKEILQLIFRENTTQEIANNLCLSVKTIESHRSNLFLKFGVKNITGLIKKTLGMGILRND